MKKILFLFLFSLLSLATLSAQTLQDVVYLKNGSIIRGIVIEQVPGQSLKIQMSDGSIFAYPLTEVTKMTREPQLKMRKLRTDAA